MKALYDSAWHHPFCAFLGGIFLALAIARRLPFLYAYLVVFLVEILADAFATGAWSPIPPGTPAYTASSVVFILLGDFRYFLFAERASRPDAPFVRVLAAATATSLVVPVTTGLSRLVVPAMENDRVLYAVYEPAACILVLALLRFRYAPSAPDAETRRWVTRVSGLFAGLYFGWAACDVAILAGLDLAHGLRILPNLLYYVAFLPFVLFTAPPSQQRAWPEAHMSPSLTTAS